MDKSKFTNVTFCGIEKAAKFVNDPFFESLSEFNDETFEVSTSTLYLVHNQDVHAHICVGK